MSLFNPNKLSSKRESSTESGPLSILRDPKKKDQALRVLNGIEDALKSPSKEEKEEWESFFGGIGFKNISDVRGVIAMMKDVLKRNDIVKATLNIKKISGIVTNYSKIERFLIEKGIMEEAA